MSSQNHESMEQQIYEAFDQLKPDEFAKDRMYAKMMRRAASPSAQKKPWYQHWQFSAGVCTAALACVVVATASIHARMPEGGTDGLQVVTPAATADQASDADTPVQNVSTESNQNDSQSTYTTEIRQTETQTQTVFSGVAVTEETWTKSTSSKSESAASETNGTAALPVQTKPAQVTVPAIVTTAAVTRTTAAQEKPSVTTTVTEAPTEPSTEPTDAPQVPMKQNIYLYYRLDWEGNHYNTQYELLSNHKLGNYLGYSVTNGADVDDTYTVLVYEIVGIDPSQQLAVQYAGEDAYYLFTVG